MGKSTKNKKVGDGGLDPTKNDDVTEEKTEAVEKDGTEDDLDPHSELGAEPTTETVVKSSEDKEESEQRKDGAEAEMETNDSDEIQSSEEKSDDDTEEPEWDLKKILSIDALQHECPIKCSEEPCTLQAAVLYMSNESVNWYGCLDCQEKHFGGWPEDVSELPGLTMTQEHKEILIAKCSKRKTVKMPEFNDSPVKGISENASSNTVTPPPKSGLSHKQNDTAANGKPVITPATGNTAKTKKAPKPNKAHLEMHRKWQAAAEEAGGPDARIVLSKPSAKKIIYDFLFDAFRPMNITEIHKGLKAVVPSPILKACLDDMSLDNDASTQFADSDDEDASKKKPSNKEASEDDLSFKGCLSFKPGKGSNSSLYYVDYNNAFQGALGPNGLDAENRNKLASDFANCEAEKLALGSSIKQMAATTTKLLSEPTNEDATSLLETGEAELAEIKEQVEAARQLKVNEKHKEQLKRRIENMASVWRKRRRLCMDFLLSMEECTDGTISVKKCLAGDGPIELESDEAVAEHAKEFAKSKRSSVLGGPKRQITKHKPSSGIQPSESFVALLLDSSGQVERVNVNYQVDA